MQDPLPNRTRGLPEERYYDPRTDESWSDILHDALAELSVNSLVSGESRADFDPEDGTMYVPADGEGPLYLGDGAEWTQLGELVDASRVTAVEDAVDVLQSDVGSLETSVSDLEGLTSTLESDLNTAESDIDAIEGDVSDLDSLTTTLQNDLNAAESDIGSVEGDVSDLETDLSNHTSAGNPHGIDADTVNAVPSTGGRFTGMVRAFTTGEGLIIGDGSVENHYISFRNSGYGPKIGFSTNIPSGVGLAFQPEENDTGKGMAFLGGDAGFGHGTRSLYMDGDDYHIDIYQGLNVREYLQLEGEDVATQTWVNNQDFGSGDGSGGSGDLDAHESQTEPHTAAARMSVTSGATGGGFSVPDTATYSAYNGYATVYNQGGSGWRFRDTQGVGNALLVDSQGNTEVAGDLEVAGEISGDQKPGAVVDTINDTDGTTPFNNSLTIPNPQEYQMYRVIGYIWGSNYSQGEGGEINLDININGNTDAIYDYNELDDANGIMHSSGDTAWRETFWRRYKHPINYTINADSEPVGTSDGNDSMFTSITSDGHTGERGMLNGRLGGGYADGGHPYGPLESIDFSTTDNIEGKLVLYGLDWKSDL